MGISRSEIVDFYRDNPEVSVLIIGAGVNGIGTFRDLALQGVDVLMVDKGDFCSGASAGSSHMVHGGIRYLENGEFRLVREAVQERNRLIENAPQYVRPLPTVIPIFRWFSGLLNAPFKFLGLLEKPSERGAVVIKIGLMFYDAFTRAQGTVPKHQFQGRGSSRAEFPHINPGVLFTARYYDGSMHTPERICIELMLDGEAAHPAARALNYVSLEAATEKRVTLKDQVSGETFEVQPRILINAAGPWIDFTNARMGLDTGLIGGTKGSHLILNNPDLRAAIGENEFFFENKDGRIVLLYPFRDRVMVGTSDLPIDNPDEATCTEEEIDYFIEMVRVVFPDIPIQRDQIVFQFTGVRPLPASDASTPGQVSRDHSIVEIPPGAGLEFPVYNLVGGKWTSFRAFSEEVCDKTLGALNRSRVVDTCGLAIGGGRDYPRAAEAQEAWIHQVAGQIGLKVARVKELFERYGTRAQVVANYIAQGDDRVLNFLPGYSQREVEFIVRDEKVVHLDDFLLRRSLLAKLGRLSHANVDEVSKIIRSAFGWTDEQADSEIKRLYKILRKSFGVQL